MLKNFITDSDLKQYHPNLDHNLWATQTDYETQTGLAFTKLESDLMVKGIDSRLVMVPYVLYNTAVSSSATGAWFEVPTNYRRLYVNVTETGATITNTFTLQGSHDKVTIVTADSLTVKGNNDESELIEDAYKYYRVVSTGTYPFTAKVELYETAFDRALIEATFIYIFRDWMKEVGDIWDLQRQLAEQDYESSLNGIKFYQDTNDNLDPDDDTATTSTLDITFVR